MKKSEIDKFYRELGERIREHRDRVDGGGMTQEQLGQRVKLSRTSIVNIEKGRQHLAAHQVCVFAEALMIPPAMLLPSGRLNESWVADRLEDTAEKTIVQWARKLK